MDDEIIGTIKLFAGNFAPVGYFTCEGQTLLIREYNALFALLGTYYGGDGVNTFK
jgi:microcystin-dependent protein